MPRSLLDQLEQVAASNAYNSAVAGAHDAGSGTDDGAETQTRLQGDMNVLRTLLHDLHGMTNWYDDIEAAPNNALTVLGVNNKYFSQRIHMAAMDNVTLASAGTSTTGFDAAIKTIPNHLNGAGNSTTEGVVVNTNYGTNGYRVGIRDSSTQDPVSDGNNNEVYGRLSFAAGTYTISWYSWVSGTETAFNLPAGTYDISYAVVSRPYKNLSWEQFFDYGWHDVSGIIGTITDENVITNVPAFAYLLSGLTTQQAVNNKVDLLGQSNSNTGGADLVGIDDTVTGTNGYFTGSVVMTALEELAAQIGGTTSTTFGFSEDNVLADNDAVYDALEKLDLKWGDLASTANGEGASLVGVEDSAGYFTATNVEGVLAELYEAIQDVAGWDKAVETGVGPITSGSPHTLPSSKTYEGAAGGQYMDVYVNGQLLVAGAGNDYTEAGVGTGQTAITFLFTVKANSNITYMIRRP